VTVAAQNDGNSGASAMRALRIPLVAMAFALCTSGVSSTL
jgi:hypothetical protein